MGRLTGLTAPLVAAAAVLTALLAWSTWSLIRGGTQVAERLMLAQAQSIADLVGESGRHGYETYRQWEDEVAARLFDNARWVARMDARRPWTDAELAALADANGLGRINLFDTAGRKVASSRIEPEESLIPRHDPADFIAPVLRGEVRELRIGFKEARFRGGQRFAVAVARSGGGAVVVNVFADSMQATLGRMQPGHVLGALGGASGVRYVLLQGPGGLIAATPERLLEDPWARTHLVTAPAAAAIGHETDSPLGRAYEVERALELPGHGSVLLRVGLDPAPLDRARAEVRTRAVTQAVLILGLGILAMGLLLVRQRQTLLAGEVTRMRAELQAREEEVRRSQRLAAMGELAAHVAHEIRNPLNTIHLTAQRLGRHDQAPEETRARLEDIRAESRRIEEIIEQFLTFARPRRPRPEQADLRELVFAAARAAEPAAEAAGVTVVVEAEPIVARVDPMMFHEVLDNLLRNAREATSPGGAVRLTLAREGRGLRVVVDDQGAGVPAELRERIFDPYFTTKAQGNGIGLSVVSQVAAAMGGGVRLEPRPGPGARFVLRLPLEGEGA